MVEVRKKEDETAAALLRRFTRKIQLAGILLEARRCQFRQKIPNKRVIRELALRRIKKQKERMRLEKLGKLKKEE